MSSFEPTIESVREYIGEALMAFVNDPPDSDIQLGYQNALYVIAVEALGLDPGPDTPEPAPKPKQVSYLRVVK